MVVVHTIYAMGCPMIVSSAAAADVSRVVVAGGFIFAAG